ncbi:MAG: adenylate/guanylate cyclase domain-containing protein [Acidimicrobiales bacterium]|nr:MAG: adenylate/guanylate cyclase domain-containing protein [Acidimicrobiales bacterium]
MFKHTGDGACAAFATPGAAVDAAIAAQRALKLPVRMGIATGEAEPRGDDYFGPVLNRVARVMAAGHGGQVLVAGSTAELVDDVELLDLGERRLRYLSGPQRVYQVVAPGLGVEFAPLRTLDSVPGNLPVQATSFVGRDREVGEVAASVREHRLVTLTGVGGVGKTRLALQVAAELAAEFVDGVWLIELAEVGQPGAVPAAVATALGLTPQPAMSVTDSVVQSLTDRRALVVLDNCEHLLDAAADLIEAVLAASSVVKVLVTSREGTRVAGEHVWSVPSFDVRQGLGSEAVGLFVERAQAVNSGFTTSDEGDAGAVVEICERLDGIALAIELAAARMASMAPSEVRDRLGDRFRLLAGGRRGLERHQTLRHAVQWSYELLDDDECAVLNRCAVFAGGFDLPAAIEVAGASDVDEYQMLDLLDSLVRKSLLTVGREHGHTRYAMLETIRQFAEDQLAAAGEASPVRDLHAWHFANGAVLNFERYYSRDQSQAVDWFESELANLRTGFRWGIERGDIDAAATIAGKLGWIGAFSQNCEPAGWCVELLESADIAQHRLLKWLYMGSAMRSFVGDPVTAIGDSETGLALPAGAFEAVTHGVDRMSLALAKLFAGQPEQYAAIAREISESPDDDLAMGPISLVWVLPILGDFDQAIDLADDMLARAEATEVPSQVAYAHNAYGRALARTDPARALEQHRAAVRVARENNLRMFEAVFSRDLAGLEASDGDLRTALDSLDQVIDTFHQTGDTANLAPTLAYLPLLFDRIDRPTQAATLYGAAARHPSAVMTADLDRVTDHLRTTLGIDGFDEHVAHGASMTIGQAVSYARLEIRTALDGLADPATR